MSSPTNRLFARAILVGFWATMGGIFLFAMWSSVQS